jgi:hypothetical protein
MKHMQSSIYIINSTSTDNKLYSHRHHHRHSSIRLMMPPQSINPSLTLFAVANSLVTLVACLNYCSRVSCVFHCWIECMYFTVQLVLTSSIYSECHSQSAALAMMMRQHNGSDRHSHRSHQANTLYCAGLEL